MKKVLSMILVLALLVSLLVGCGKKDDEDPKDDPTPTETETPDGDDDDVEEPADDLEEHVTITMWLHGNSVSNDADVMEEVNSYLNDKLNMTLKPIWGTWGDFDEAVVLSIDGGDTDVDIYFTCSWSANEYNAYSRKGAFLKLDDENNNLIDKYASDLWNLLPDVLTDGAIILGDAGFGTYAVPGYKDIATQNCWDVNVPLLEKYGYTVDDIANTDYYGFEDILKTVKEGEGDNFYPLLVEGAVLERMVTNSIIVTGDSGEANLLSYYIDPTKTSNPSPKGEEIFNKFATDEYKKFVEKTREYFLAGYIAPEMSNADQANDVRTDMQKAGDYLIGTQSYALGYEHQASAERGFEVAMVPCTPPYVDTTSAQGAMMAISSSSANPERAMMFLNLLNTDPYLMTLFAYGIEGTHYELENGEVVFNEEARGEYAPWTNGIGNVTQLPPLKGQGADFQDTFKEFYGEADEIPILGYAFDSTPVDTQLASLANVAGEYTLSLSTGAIDPETALPEFLQKLEDNGMADVVKEANDQLQAYLAGTAE